MPYQDYTPTVGPTWLQRPFGAAFLSAFGSVKDFFVSVFKQGVKARMPLIANSDALLNIGTERGIFPGLNESQTAYAGRVTAAWDTWLYAGTARGLLAAFRAAGYFPATSTLRLMQQQGFNYTMDASGNVLYLTNPTGFQIDQVAAHWNKFLVLIVPPYQASWGTTPPSNSSGDAALARKIITQWKPALAVCTQIIVYQSGELWDYPTGLWGDAGTWSSTANLATYWTYP